jgi:hypothetical protein
VPQRLNEAVHDDITVALHQGPYVECEAVVVAQLLGWLLAVFFLGA